MNNKSEIAEEAEGIRQELISWRRAFHRIPELKMETIQTEKLLVEILQRLGADEIRSGIGGHGVSAMVHGSFPGPVIAIRADCDGLPIKEETGLPFASTNGNMHACGHDAHTAMALGALKICLEHRSELHGSVKFIFQPYEEGDGGAKAMIQAGVLEGVCEILALHTGNIMGKEYCSGDVVYPQKYASANIWAFKAVYTGKGAHVCKPQEANSPLIMAAEAAIRVRDEAAVKREEDRPVIAAVTMIHGGVRNNIVPETCEIQGSVRAYSKQIHRELKEQIQSILKESAENNRGTVQIEDMVDLMSCVNDDLMKERFIRAAATVVEENKLLLQQEPVSMGEDFARYADLIPAFYFYLCSKKKGCDHPHHHPGFDIDEEVLPTGAALFAAYALDRLNQPVR